MTYRVVQLEDAPAYDGMAASGSTTFQPLVDAILGTGIVSGFVASVTSGWTLAIASGTGIYQRVPYSSAGGSVTLANPSTNDRVDCIVVNQTTGAISGVQGTPCSVPGWTRALSTVLPPVMPNVSAGYSILWSVYVRGNGDGGAPSGVSLTYLTDWRTPADQLLKATSNLSDLTSASAARTNLGLGSLATASSVAASGDATGTLPGALTLAASGVTAGTYGDGTHVAQVTVDAKGRLTSASSVAITASSGVSSFNTRTGAVTLLAADVTSVGGVLTSTSLGGSLTGTLPNPTLANYGVGAGTYGTQYALPIVTASADGRLSAITTSGVIPVINAANPTYGTTDPTGVTDCSTAFAAAWAAAQALATSAIGVVFYIPGGTWKHNTGIFARSSTSDFRIAIVGAGVNVTTLKAVGAGRAISSVGTSSAEPTAPIFGFTLDCSLLTSGAVGIYQEDVIGQYYDVYTSTPYNSSGVVFNVRNWQFLNTNTNYFNEETVFGPNCGAESPYIGIEFNNASGTSSFGYTFMDNFRIRVNRAGQTGIVVRSTASTPLRPANFYNSTINVKGNVGTFLNNQITYGAITAASGSTFTVGGGLAYALGAGMTVVDSTTNTVTIADGYYYPVGYTGAIQCHGSATSMSGTAKSNNGSVAHDYLGVLQASLSGTNQTTLSLTCDTPAIGRTIYDGQILIVNDSSGGTTNVQRAVMVGGGSTAGVPNGTTLVAGTNSIPIYPFTPVTSRNVAHTFATGTSVELASAGLVLGWYGDGSTQDASVMNVTANLKYESNVGATTYAIASVPIWVTPGAQLTGHGHVNVALYNSGIVATGLTNASVRPIQWDGPFQGNVYGQGTGLIAYPVGTQPGYGGVTANGAVVIIGSDSAAYPSTTQTERAGMYKLNDTDGGGTVLFADPGLTSGSGQALLFRPNGPQTPSPQMILYASGVLGGMTVVAPTGLTGATATSRYVGASASGAPSGSVTATAVSYASLVLVISGATGTIEPGAQVSGTGVGAGITVGAVSGTSITLNTAPSGTPSGTITFATQFNLGDWAIDQTGAIWVCTTAGLGGAAAWTTVGSTSGAYLPLSGGTLSGATTINANFTIGSDNQLIFTGASSGASIVANNRKIIGLPIGSSTNDSTPFGQVFGADLTNNGLTGATIGAIQGTAISGSTGAGGVVLSASPTLTGDPAAPTQALLDNSPNIATTRYVQNALPAQPTPGCNNLLAWSQDIISCASSVTLASGASSNARVYAHLVKLDKTTTTTYGWIAVSTNAVAGSTSSVYMYILDAIAQNTVSAGTCEAITANFFSTNTGGTGTLVAASGGGCKVPWAAAPSLPPGYYYICLAYTNYGGSPTHPVVRAGNNPSGAIMNIGGSASTLGLGCRITAQDGITNPTVGSTVTTTGWSNANASPIWFGLS